MNERRRERLIVLVVMAMVAGLVLAMQQGCGTVAGIGRDLTAMADGMARDSAANAEAIRGKGQ